MNTIHQTLRRAATLAASFSCTLLAQAQPAPPISPAPVVNYEYDAQGNRTRVVQAPGVSGFNFSTASTYDALSRLKDSTDARSGRTQFGYNGRDDLTAVSDPRNLLTQYPRDGLGQAMQVISPDTGTASQTYDAGGNLKTRTDSRGVLATYSYDALNRPTSVVYSGGGLPSVSYTWTYDQTGSGFSNGIGRLTTASYPAGSDRYAYDALGRLISSTTITSTATLVTAYEYDAAGNVTAITYPSGRKLFISYAGGKPAAMSLAMSAGSTPVPLISAIQYEPFGGVSGWQWSLASGATQAHQRLYDGAGRMVRYRLGKLLRDLSYDAADRITGFTHYDANTGAPAPSNNQAFGYDELGRLTAVSTASQNWAYSYDANGNRTSVNTSSGLSSYTTDSASNRLLAVSGGRALGYDAAGNTAADSGAPAYSAEHDASNRLTGMWISTGTGFTTSQFFSYTYNDKGLRTSKANTATRYCSSPSACQTVAMHAVPGQFVYDPQGHLLGEYQGASQPGVEYIWLGDTPVALIKPVYSSSANPAQAYFVHADHLDTPRVVVDQANNLRWTRFAEPFGTTTANDNPAGLGAFTVNLRNPGQFWDAESGLHYNWNRFYDPGIGRYSQSDPIGLAGGINTYAYVGGNPLSYVDPEGRNLTLGGIVVVGGIIYGGYKLYDKFRKFNQEVEACKRQCESTVACGDSERTGLYQDNAARCIATCKANATIGSFFGIGKGQTGPKSPETTPDYFKPTPPTVGRP